MATSPDSGIFGAPAVVALELVNFCNSRCVFCPLFQGNDRMDPGIRPPAVMTSQLFGKLIDEISHWDKKPDTLYLNMHGEPLLDRKFSERLDLLKQAGLSEKVDLQTNGEFLDEAVSTAIVRSGVRRVTIGFDGASRKVYEEHRVGCHYDVVLQNISNFARIRDSLNGPTRVAIQYVRTKKNSHEVLKAYELFSRILNSDLDCFQDTISKNWGCEDMDMDDNILHRTSESQRATTYCQMLDTQLIVLVDGSVAVCCWDYNLSVFDGPLGNVNKETLLDVWQGEKFQRLRSIMRGKGLYGKPVKCHACTFLYPTIPYADKCPPAVDRALVQVADAGYAYSFRKSDGLASRFASPLRRMFSWKK